MIAWLRTKYDRFLSNALGTPGRQCEDRAEHDHPLTPLMREPYGWWDDE